MPNIDLICDLRREDIQILSNRIIQGQLSLLCQLSDGDSSERFVDGSEIELGIWVIGHLESFGGITVGSVEEAMSARIRLPNMTLVVV